MKMPKSDITSPYYPYFKVQEGFYNFKEFAEFPKMLCDYLLDAPKGDYQPIDDNDYPRCRLWKYLYYDGEKPLNNPLPTIQQKMSLLFNPDKPTEPPTAKGYRLIPQEYIKQSQEDAQTRIYVYMGRTIASRSNTTFTTSIVFDVFTHYTYELNTKSDIYSRSGAIVAALIDALNGVNIDGVGTFSMSKAVHTDCQTRPIFDGNENVGHELVMGLEMSAIDTNKKGETSNMPKISGNIRLA